MRYIVDDWPRDRIAKFGFLVALGWSAGRIADYFGKTHNNIFRQATRFGLSFRITAKILSHDVFAQAAAKRGITADQLVDRLLAEIAADPVLIDNVLDDDVECAA